MSMNIAIDGPAGAGKSTIAKKLAAGLGFVYVDTGAMYRAMAYYFLNHGIKAEEEEKIASACDSVDVTITYQDGAQQVILNGENITAYIRTEEVGNMASATSVYPVVRTKLVELQRQLAKKENVIMDGVLMRRNLQAAGFDERWLRAQLKLRGYSSYRQILLATCDTEGVLTVYPMDAKAPANWNPFA